MKEYVTFDDVLIKPKFSKLTSRKDVDLSVDLKGDSNTIVVLGLPVLSANMDTVTGPAMAIAMAKAGGLGVLHRFGTIAESIEDFQRVDNENVTVAVSVGVGGVEQKRARELYEAGARIFCLDVAHGAQQQVVDMYTWMKETLIDIFVIVGNFATAECCSAFWAALNNGGIKYFTRNKGKNSQEHVVYGVDAFKIGIGPGSACTTRIKTGVGVPQLGAVMEVAEYFKDYLHKPMIICDGGMKTPGDIAKAIAAGADLVMLGGMLAGTTETPGDLIYIKDEKNSTEQHQLFNAYKAYRGSASKESYADQGKDASHRTAEGESFTIPSKGSVAQVLQDIEGGLRSSFTYIGAKDVHDFQKRAEFVKITANCARENGAHGKN